MDLSKMPKNVKLELYFQINETIESAKRDLEKNISKEELEILYKKKYFKTEEEYLKIKDAITSLEMIIELYSPVLEQLRENLDNVN